ncbi:MAG TPA: PKD domain-containing protein [Spirochaetia bacterium]|nr:PKD domain-containing protein [Spirochaetia bacterium]
MLELLKKQRIKGRHSKKKGGSKHLLSTVIDGIVRRLIIPHRTVFFLVIGLVSLSVTAILFSTTLEHTLSGAERATGLTMEDEREISTLALDTAYDELGAGTYAFTTRDTDIEYVMQEGDSLFSIGKLYVIDPEDLKQYNSIAQPHRMPVGTKIVIPSRQHLAAFRAEQKKLAAERRRNAPPPAPAPRSLLPAQAAITVRTKEDGPLLNAMFEIETPLPEEGIYYHWDLGDGTISRNKSIEYTYLKPGTYSVTLTLKDKYGYQVRSNTVSIEVSATEGSKVVKTVYLTLSGKGEIFALSGKVAQTEDFLGGGDKPVTFIEERDNHYFYRAERTGYFYLIARSDEAVYKVYLFVSPFPSVHADRFDVNWYRTQYNTGPSNCGPATVSMAVAWATGANVPINSIRRYIGWRGDGGTSFNQLMKALTWKGVRAEIVDIQSPDDLFQVIDQGKIAIILYHSGRISWTKGRPEENLVGRYYADSTGHYVIIKGYSVDKQYLVIYDPIPSDWVSNGKRYGDGVSMIGRNRYYLVSEMFRALSLKKILLISR